MENIKRALWMIVRAGLFRPSFHNWYGWRRLLLQLFGAKLGKGVRIRPTAFVEIPWNLSVGDDVVIGDYAIIYSLGKITHRPGLDDQPICAPLRRHPRLYDAAFPAD